MTDQVPDSDTDDLQWDLTLESVSSLMLQGAEAWGVFSAMPLLEPEDVEDMMADVRYLWGRDATEGLDPALDRGLAQLKRIQSLAWERWQDEKDPRILRQIQDVEREILSLRGEIADRLAEKDMVTTIERLPAWVSSYLAAWGSKSEGHRVTVGWAAEMAGTTASNVRMLRKDSARFRRMEDMARFGDAKHMASLVDAGLKGNAVIIFEAFMDLVRKRNSQVVLKAIEWLADKPAVLLQVAAMSDAQLFEKYGDLIAGVGGDQGAGQGQGPDPASSTESDSTAAT